MADPTEFTLDDGTDGGSNGGSDIGAIDPAVLAGTGNGDGSDDRTFDPDRHIGRDRINADGTFRRKRQRGSKRGSDAAPKGKALPYNLSAVEGMLFNIHAVLGTRVPEIVLTSEEARTLAEAMIEVQRHYPNTVFSPVVAAWMNLGIVAGGVYIPRIVNIRARVAKEREEQAPQEAALSFPFGQAQQ